MKKYLVIAFWALLIDANAQISFEHQYDSASTFASGSPAENGQLMIIKFELSGERYVRINRWGKTIDIYDMNHALLKTISLASLPLQGGSGLGPILYLSEQLFDTNSKIEFMYGITSPAAYVGIYNEDGNLLFSDTGFVPIYVTIPQQQYPIYNTTGGTKMILSYQIKYSSDPPRPARVFSLPGTLTMAVQQGNDQLVAQGSLSNLYPNPSNGAVALQYELPKGEKVGEIILYNQFGAEVKRYQVDNTFNDLILDNAQLPAATYFYLLKTSKGIIGTKKMIVVK